MKGDDPYLDHIMRKATRDAQEATAEPVRHREGPDVISHGGIELNRDPITPDVWRGEYGDIIFQMYFDGRWWFAAAIANTASEEDVGSIRIASFAAMDSTEALSQLVARLDRILDVLRRSLPSKIVVPEDSRAEDDG